MALALLSWSGRQAIESVIEVPSQWLCRCEPIPVVWIRPLHCIPGNQERLFRYRLSRMLDDGRHIGESSDFR